MSGKPTTSFILVLIAAIIVILFGISTLVNTSYVLPIVGGSAASWIARIVVAISIWWFICGGILLIASSWIRSGEPNKVRNGGIVAIIFSILTLNLIVIILGLIGGVLALTWKPSTKISSLKEMAEQKLEETI